MGVIIIYMILLYILIKAIRKLDKLVFDEHDEFLS